MRYDHDKLRYYSFMKNKHTELNHGDASFQPGSNDMECWHILMYTQVQYVEASLYYFIVETTIKQLIQSCCTNLIIIRCSRGTQRKQQRNTNMAQILQNSLHTHYTTEHDWTSLGTRNLTCEPRSIIFRYNINMSLSLGAFYHTCN